MSVKIKGDGNQVYSNVKNSTINSQNTTVKTPQKVNWTLCSVLVAIIGVVVAVIVGWNNIIAFFTN